MTPASTPSGTGGSAPGLVLDVRGLTIDLPTARGYVRVVDDVSFSVRSGRTTGIIGESGSGKSQTVLAILGLSPRGARISGQILWKGQNLVGANDATMRGVRGHQIAMIFQDPLSALNPTQTIGRQVGEILRRSGMPTRKATARAIELLERAGLPDPARRAKDYPHRFSGGMRQRAVIAMALAGEPALILADEPTTALDVTVQARILTFLASLTAEEGLSMVFVSHDLRVMNHVADDLVVMHDGVIVERGNAKSVLQDPHHSYTQMLVRSVPSVHSRSVIAAPEEPSAAATGATSRTLGEDR